MIKSRCGTEDFEDHNVSLRSVQSINYNKFKKNRYYIRAQGYLMLFCFSVVLRDHLQQLTNRRPFYDSNFYNLFNFRKYKFFNDN